MTTTQTKIVDLFDSLEPRDREAMAEQLYQRARPNFLARMTPEQRAELEIGLTEADHDEGSSEADTFQRLESQFGVKLT